MPLEFRSSDHTYWLDGVRVPGVSEVLRSAGLVDARWYNDLGRERGKAVAEAIALDLHGELDPDTVDPEHVAPYLAAYRTYAVQSCNNHLRPVEIETPRINRALRYAGRPDLYAQIEPTVRAVIEWKTGAPAPWHIIQLVAYMQLDWPDTRPCVGAIIYLNRKGDYHIKTMRRTDGDYQSVLDVFRSALNVYYWKEIHP